MSHPRFCYAALAVALLFAIPSFSQAQSYNAGYYPSPAYPSQVYSQPVYSQPVYSQPVYSQPVYSPNQATYSQQGYSRGSTPLTPRVFATALFRASIGYPTRAQFNGPTRYYNSDQGRYALRRQRTTPTLLRLDGR